MTILLTFGQKIRVRLIRFNHINKKLFELKACLNFIIFRGPKNNHFNYGTNIWKNKLKPDLIFNKATKFFLFINH